MKSWENIVKTATLGTNRTPFRPTDLEVWQEALVQDKENEEALLQLAGAFAIARRAGYIPKKTKAKLPEQAEEEELEYVFAGANQYFKTDDVGTFDLFIHELVRNERIIQPVFLPKLFDAAIRFKSNPETIMKVAGNRGQWFLQFYPKADYFKDAMDVDWETGTIKDRLRFAEKLRHKEPQRARELIEAVINEESLADVQKFLYILRINLSEEDVPFLSLFLERKSKAICHIAASFLAILPNTEIHQQMIDFGNELLVSKKSKLSVELPDGFVKRAKKFLNISSNLSISKDLGEKSRYFTQIISYVPLKHWETHFKKKPAQLIALGEKTLFTHALLVAWAMAAIKYKNAEWAALLLESCALKNEKYYKWFEPNIYLLVQIVEKEKLQEILIKALKKEGANINGESPVFLLLASLKQIIEVETAQTFFEQLKKVLKKQKHNYLANRLFTNLKKMAKIFPVEILPYLNEHWKSDIFGKLEKYEKSFNEMYHILEFRYRMLKNIKGE